MVTGQRHWFDSSWSYLAECTGCAYERVGSWDEVQPDADYHTRLDHTRHVPRLPTF